MRYTSRPPKRRIVKRVVFVGVGLVLLLLAATAVVRYTYFKNLEPVSTSTTGQPVRITIESGATVDQIAKQLKDAGLIRSTWAFRLYVSSKDVREQLEAGTYSLEPRQSLPEIVSQLTHGKVATDLVTIIPGQRIDQIRTTLENYGFSKDDVHKALDPNTYIDNPALVDKPAGASLEGYIYPDSYQKTDKTTAQQIVSASLKEMEQKLTPQVRADFAKQGLSTYQGLVLASIVEQEVSRQSDRAMAAQVFLKRLSIGMPLGSDVTAYYGANIAGKGKTLLYDSPYNTRLHAGLPPTPISNVGQSSLEAVAHPSNTDYLYFVAGDDGATHFTHTLQEHQDAAAQYCHRLCSE
jgi:UPF0755 protein